MVRDGRRAPGPSLQPALELQRQERLPLGYAESPTFVLGMRHLYADRLDEAREVLAQEAADAKAHGDDWAYAGALLHLMELECRAGRMEAAGGYGAELLLRQEQRGERFQGGPSFYAAALVDLIGATSRKRVRGWNGPSPSRPDRREISVP